MNGLEQEWEEEDNLLDKFTGENLRKTKQIIAPEEEIKGNK